MRAGGLQLVSSNSDTLARSELRAVVSQCTPPIRCSDWEGDAQPSDDLDAAKGAIVWPLLIAFGLGFLFGGGIL